MSNFFLPAKGSSRDRKRKKGTKTDRKVSSTPNAVSYVSPRSRKVTGRQRCYLIRVRCASFDQKSRLGERKTRVKAASLDEEIASDSDEDE